MDYEKKYKEALELARVAAFNGHQNLMEGIFPELKESDDEKVREDIISLVNEFWERIGSINPEYSSRSRMLAWLKNIPYTIDHEKREGFHLGYKAALEKQGEQKPTDKVEPKFKVKYAGSEYNVFETKEIAGVTFYGIEDEPNHIDYVKANNCEIISGYAIKENGSPYPTNIAVFSEQKPTWSEEDEKMCQETIDWFEKKCFPYALESENPARESIKWLKSLKQRIGG